MNLDFVPVPDDSTRSAQLLLYANATPLQIIQGSATGALDLSPYVKAMKQKPAQLDFTLTWHSELNGMVPVPGNLVVVNLGLQLLWTGIVEEVSSYQMDRGTRELGITARTRDGNALWRTSPRVSDIYPAGTQLTFIAQQLATAIGLSAPEIALPSVSAYTVHNNVQMANLSVWDMLTTLYQAVGLQPYIDGKGRLKCISRDTQRAPDITLTPDRAVAITGSYSKRQKTAVRVKWLDPNLTQVIQAAQSLATASLTAGFFQSDVKKQVGFSSDNTQQALDTYLVIKQSCNSGLLPVAEETYEQLSPTQGQIDLINTYFALAFITNSLAGVLAASYIPDGVVLFETVPVGRVVQGIGLFFALVAMSSIGTGSYEIWGQPYSWVHQMNTTEAYDVTAPAWQESIVEIENDFVMNEAMSEAFATRELLYEVQSAVSYGGQIVDDPRIEVGDILGLPDGSQIYVTDFTRDLSRGAPAILDVTGFQAGATGSAIAQIDSARVPVTGTITTDQGQFAGLPTPVTGTATTAQGQSAGSVGIASNKPFPRFAIWAGTGAQLPKVSNQNGFAQYPWILLGGDFPSAVGPGSQVGETRDQVVTGLKTQPATGKNAVVPMVFQYENPTEQNDERNETDLQAIVTKNNWWVYNRGSGGSKPDSTPPYVGIVNSCHGGGTTGVAAIAKDSVTGLWPSELMSQYLHDRYFGGNYAPGGNLATATSFAVMGSTSLNGQYVDNQSGYLRFSGDYLRNNTTQMSPNGGAAAMAAYLTGMADVGKRWRAIDPDRQIIGNMAFAAFAAYGIDSTPINGIFDYPEQQFMFGRGISAVWQYHGFAYTMAQYKAGIAISHNGSCSMSAQYKPGDYQMLRHDQCFTLMDNGYLRGGFSSSGTADGSDPNDPATWPVCDEFWGGAQGLGGFLGNRIGAVQTGPTQNGIWRADFDNGIVLINSTQAPATISLGGTFYHLRSAYGAQAINDHSAATSVTLGTFNYDSSNSAGGGVAAYAGHPIVTGDACILMRSPT